MDVALKHSMAAYGEDPSNAGLVCNVGVCHLGLGHLDQAEEFLTIARDLDRARRWREAGAARARRGTRPFDERPSHGRC